VLTKTMQTLSTQVLRDKMMKAKAELFAAIDSNETAAALTEMTGENPAANTEAGAELDIGMRMDQFLTRAEARRATLMSRLNACAQ
jgi:hypothetical protein